MDFVGPNNSGLPLDKAPRYFWIDGIKHRAGKMDFEASGFVGVRFCEGCGNRTDDIGLTYSRRHATPPPPFVFAHDEASGLELFTTDLAPTAFFCSRCVLLCAQANKLTNISFCPIEQGVFGQPIAAR
jgi:hypothetical protein